MLRYRTLETENRKGKKENSKGLALVFLFCLLFSIFYFLFSDPALVAQEGEPIAYELTEVERLRLENLRYQALLIQADIRLLEIQFQARQQDFAAALAALQTEAERIRQDHNWPEDAVFDLDTLAFTTTPPRLNEGQKQEDDQ